VRPRARKDRRKGPRRARQGDGSMKRSGLDATDIRILSAVQAHGQLSKTRLAEIVNLSPTPCWARLDRLKAAGYIRNYRAEIALDKICDFTQVIVTVSLTHHRKADFERFEAYVRGRDEIVHCIATGGGMDYILTVYVHHIAAFEALMDDLLADELRIDRYITYFATRRVKSSHPNIAKLAAPPE
jgi:Lrp/AsnC family transcriptional regulator of ectoine degradation